MTDKRQRTRKAFRWVLVSLGIDLILGVVYYLQYKPECKLSTLAWICVAYVVVGLVSHYLLAKHIVDQEEIDKNNGSNNTDSSC